MIAYIIKSSLCLMFLWAFYKLFLEKENIHFVKRFYLLFSLVFAFVIPLITLTYQIEVIPEPEVISETTIPIMMEPEAIIVEESINYTPIILWSIYGIGVLIFGFRFTRNIIDILKKIRSNERLKESSHINVLLSNSIIPHTFLDYIFVPKKEFKDKNIPEEVLLHEKTHVLQKHTLDILFVEILQVFFWFNPLFIFIKRSIKLNHEFLADHSVLKHQFSIQNYFELLLNYPNSSDQAVLSSPINYSLTKKRLQMMTKEFSKKRTMLKLVTLAPVLSLCVLFFNNEIVAKEVELPLDEITYPDVEVLNPLEKSSIIVLKDKEEYSSLDENLNSFQEGVTEEMVKEYNVWAKDLHAKIKGNKPIIVEESEIYRMINIYRSMTAEQRKGSEKFPDIPPPPPVPEAPKVMKGQKSDIPPPPPPPEAPKVKKGEKSNIPPPPPPKVKKGEKSDIPPPPPPAPEAPSPNNGSYIDVKFSEQANLSEDEKEAYIERVEEKLAKQREEQERELEQIRTEEMTVLAEAKRLIAEAEHEERENRKDAIAGIEQAEIQRTLAMEQIQLAREQAEKARVLAAGQTREARAIAREEAQIARELARKETRNSEEQEALRAERAARKAAIEAERAARKAEMKSRSAMLKAEAKSRKAMKKVEKEARKAEMEARRNMLEAEMKARKAQQRAMMVDDPPSRNEFIERMAKKNAEFYYEGKQISAKQALELVENSNDNLSINASTKNGKSKVTLKD
ncbi:M56 family metallopeptidase [uncultured Aquimarina sp.]|uniref:M56 family metallopeptidase n=1 Tax=uncultured Aquimarina sp. TaxID=575652 RepID=UPI00260A5D23|nr:M56 family metallopeptidase [uncultured Aquimarina sp.]